MPVTADPDATRVVEPGVEAGEPDPELDDLAPPALDPDPDPGAAAYDEPDPGPEPADPPPPARAEEPWLEDEPPARAPCTAPARGATGRRRRGRRARRRRGRARGDARLPPGDPGARPALVRAEAAARLRLRQLSGRAWPRRRYTLVDVFTSTRLQGNPLAVVHDADGLPAAIMHAFARETRLSETSFVQTADDPAADYRNRIWMPTGEVPFAGHPSLGVAAAVARERGQDAVTYHQQTIAGIQPVDVELRGRRRPLLDAAGAARDRRGARSRRGDGRARPRRRGRAPRAAVPAREHRAAPRPRARPRRSRRALAHAPRRASASAACSPRTARSASTRRRSTRSAGAPARARSSPPGRTRPPAPPPARCARGSPPAPGVLALEVTQGVEMGRASRLSCRLEGDRVRVGGDVAVVVDGTVHLDG